MNDTDLLENETPVPTETVVSTETVVPNETALPSVLDEREALRQSIAEDKAELLDAVGELKTSVQQQFELRRRIAKNPVRWLLGGTLLGLWLGSRKYS